MVFSTARASYGTGSVANVLRIGSASRGGRGLSIRVSRVSQWYQPWRYRGGITSPKSRGGPSTFCPVASAARASACMSIAQSLGVGNDRSHPAARKNSSNPAGLQMVRSSASSEVNRYVCGSPPRKKYRVARLQLPPLMARPKCSATGKQENSFVFIRMHMDRRCRPAAHGLMDHCQPPICGVGIQHDTLDTAADPLEFLLCPEAPHVSERHCTASNRRTSSAMWVTLISSACITSPALGWPSSPAVVPVIVKVSDEAGLGWLPSEQLLGDGVGGRCIELDQFPQETEVVGRVLPADAR